MAKKTASLLPSTDDLLSQFGDRLRVARLRRRLTAKQVAERAGMAPMTLRSLERGSSGVTMGAYLSVMQVLGIESDLNLLGKADPLGRELQDAQLPSRAKVTRTPSASRVIASAGPEKTAATRPSSDAQTWIKQGGFASSESLAGLIAPTASPKASRKKKAH